MHESMKEILRAFGNEVLTAAQHDDYESADQETDSAPETRDQQADVKKRHETVGNAWGEKAWSDQSDGEWTKNEEGLINLKRCDSKASHGKSSNMKTMVGKMTRGHWLSISEKWHSQLNLSIIIIVVFFLQMD